MRWPSTHQHLEITSGDIPAVYTCANPAFASHIHLPSTTSHCFPSLSSFCTLRIHSDQLFLCFVCYPCIISSYPFDCPVHPDALHPPSTVVSSSCATPSCSYYPLLLCRQMAGCRPARREPANLPAGIAAKRGQDGCWGREGIDGWSPPRLGCSGRGNHAQLLRKCIFCQHSCVRELENDFFVPNDKVNLRPPWYLYQMVTQKCVRTCRVNPVISSVVYLQLFIN